MHGDFSRISFQPDKNFLRVLQLQGRPLLEADQNERDAIALHYLQALAADILGPYAALSDDSFRIEADQDGHLFIHPGTIYVDGVRVTYSAADPVKFTEQPHYQPDAVPDTGLIYLDVFERVVFPAEDSTYTEPALNHTYTSLRTQLVWQVKVEENRTPPNRGLPGDRDEAVLLWPDWVDLWQSKNRGRLNVQLKEGKGSGAAPCAIPPDAAYRGLQNQLYRVEIHKSGNAKTATFKWSRENGAIIVGLQPLGQGESPSPTVKPHNPQAVDWSQWKKDTWVEVLTQTNLHKATPGSLMQITAAPKRDGHIVLSDSPDEAVVMLRRWDTTFDAARRDRLKQHDDNAAKIEGGKWLSLENGIEIQFDADAKHEYREGDYWLIAARTGGDDLLWETDANGAYVAQLPHGVQHHYAPLAVLKARGQPPLDLRFVLNRPALFK